MPGRDVQTRATCSASESSHQQPTAPSSTGCSSGGGAAADAADAGNSSHALFGSAATVFGVAASSAFSGVALARTAGAAGLPLVGMSCGLISRWYLQAVRRTARGGGEEEGGGHQPAARVACARHALGMCSACACLPTKYRSHTARPDAAHAHHEPVEVVKVDLVGVGQLIHDEPL